MLYVICFCHPALEKKRKDYAFRRKATTFRIKLMRSPVLYRAAQVIQPYIQKKSKLAAQVQEHGNVASWLIVTWSLPKLASAC